MSLPDYYPPIHNKHCGSLHAVMDPSMSTDPPVLGHLHLHVQGKNLFATSSAKLHLITTFNQPN